MKYKIIHWTDFDSEIDKAVKLFFAKNHVYPNILSANGKTLSTINMFAYMNKGNTRNILNKNLRPNGIVNIGLFSGATNDYSLTICFEKKLKTDILLLIYDSNPKFVSDGLRKAGLNSGE